MTWPEYQRWALRYGERTITHEEHARYEAAVEWSQWAVRTGYFDSAQCLLDQWSQHAYSEGVTDRIMGDQRQLWRMTGYGWPIANGHERHPQPQPGVGQ